MTKPILGKVLYGNCLKQLKKLPDKSIHMCVTSPPYFGLRDYGHDEQIGLEDSPNAYIQTLADVFSQVHRVLKDSGTLWINIGDSYSGSGKGMTTEGMQQTKTVKANGMFLPTGNDGGLKPKNLIGIPWKLAFELQNRGWYLRQDIIWSKPNCMPSSVKDRCTTSHEYIFLLSKSPRYYYDYEAIMEQTVNSDTPKQDAQRSKRDSFKRTASKRAKPIHGQTLGTHREDRAESEYDTTKKNKRSVWSVPTKPYKGSHSAVFPPDLIKPCILAGTKPNGIVLDPFLGSGTTAAVAILNRRRYFGIELNSGHKPLIDRRIKEAEVYMENVNQPKLFWKSVK